MSRANPNFFSTLTVSLLVFSIVFGTIIIPISSSFVPVAKASSNYAVTIIDYAFQPLHINITTGTTVTWTYSSSGATIHTVTSDYATNKSSDGTPLLNSGDLNPGQSFSYTFDLPGYYPYQCEVHPTLAAMNGWVRVTGNPITSPGSSGSTFPWILVTSVAVAAVAAIAVALVVVNHRKSRTSKNSSPQNQKSAI